MGPNRIFLMFLATILLACASWGQTQQSLTNSDILSMTKQGFDSNLIVKDIESSATDFDVSPQALIELKNADVSQAVMEAMLTAHAKKPTAAVEAAHGSGPAGTASNGSKSSGCSPPSGCLLRDGSEVPLKFATEISSKTANVGDPVEFVLDGDLKVSEKVVVPKGAHAVATISTAKKAGMVGRPGDLSVQMQYLIVADNHVRLRGTKGKEGESKTGATVALTVLFGPIGLIKHGKDVQIPAGTPLTAYVDQDIWLPVIDK